MLDHEAHQAMGVPGLDKPLLVIGTQRTEPFPASSAQEVRNVS
jgi:hypothetical protein